MFSGYWFRGGLDGYKWIPCGNLHKSAVSKDGHGSMWHQILLAYLGPGIIKSLDAKQAWSLCHAETFPARQLLAVCLLKMGPADIRWPGLLPLSRITVARYGCERGSHSDVYTNVGISKHGKNSGQLTISNSIFLLSWELMQTRVSSLPLHKETGTRLQV